METEEKALVAVVICLIVFTVAGIFLCIKKLSLEERKVKALEVAAAKYNTAPQTDTLTLVEAGKAKNEEL